MAWVSFILLLLSSGQYQRLYPSRTCFGRLDDIQKRIEGSLLTFE